MKRNRIAIMSLILAITVFICSIPLLNRITHQNDWKSKTTPLPDETIELLCAQFGLPSDHLLCNGKNDVYALDFVKVMDEKFKPYETYGINSDQSATFDDVEKTIGIYKYECESIETTGDGFTFFTCSYDLRGDKKFVVTILYTYPEKAVMRIMSTSRFED
jgi:hypothetical protein